MAGEHDTVDAVEIAADAASVRAVDALRDLNFAANRFRASVAEHFGVGVRETEAVAHLDAHGELTAGELARILSVSPGTVTDLLERLERADLATRVTDPGDHRRILVRPTARAGELVVRVRGWLAGCLAALAEPDSATDTLERLGEQLRRAGDELRAGREPGA